MLSKGPRCGVTRQPGRKRWRRRRWHSGEKMLAAASLRRSRLLPCCAVAEEGGAGPWIDNTSLFHRWRLDRLRLRAFHLSFEGSRGSRWDGYRIDNQKEARVALSIGCLASLVLLRLWAVSQPPPWPKLLRRLWWSTLRSRLLFTHGIQNAPCYVHIREFVEVKYTAISRIY